MKSQQPSSNDDFGFNYDNTFIQLPDILYTKINPRKVESPSLALFNHNLAKQLGLYFDVNNQDEVQQITAILSGKQLTKNSTPIAMAYAGHQFGYFVILGDGRAHLLGEHLCPNKKRVDIQLKGSGQTPYSRSGDGLAALAPMLREYIISEAMHALKIKTTRSLAVVLTNQKVYRETALNGAILTRVADSHLRIGSFQYLASQKQLDALKELTDYAIKRHYPKILQVDDKKSSALKLLESVMNAQIRLMVDWLRVGFIHGVMNTDNTTISGETIDYGPCAFMDDYHPNTVFSSIDKNGRYAYANQVQIIQWNLARFAESLLPLIDKDSERALKQAKQTIDSFGDKFQKQWLKMMRKKFGLLADKKSDKQEGENQDLNLITQMLNWMELNQADFNNTFRDLTFENFENKIYQDSRFQQWLKDYQKRKKQNANPKKAKDWMKNNNPIIIPRNHQVEKALNLAEEKLDFSMVHSLIEATSNPYQNNSKYQSCQSPPKEHEKVHQTFCGT